MKLSRYDKVQLIIEHMVNQGIEDSEQFFDYLESLLTFDDYDLDNQLSILENLAE